MFQTRISGLRLVSAWHTAWLLAVFVSGAVVPALGPAGTALAASGACPAPAADYGKDAVSINVPTMGTYRVWSHLWAPSAAANTFMLQIDGMSCFTVGGSSVTPNAWSWTQTASDGTTVSLPDLTAGAHTLTLIGTAPGVMLDGLFLTSDLTCQPAGDGKNCDSQVDAGVSPSLSPGASAAPVTTVAGTHNSPKSNANLYVPLGIFLILSGAGVLAWVVFQVRSGAVSK